MSVKVIRKQSGQANEVTDAMLEVIKCVTKESEYSIAHYIAIYKAMEAARIAEVGEIERIEVRNIGDTGASTLLKINGNGVFIDAYSPIDKDNLIPLAEALLELGKQMKGAV